MESPDPTAPPPPPPRGAKHFFMRGLAVLLPTVLTIWIVVAAYAFVRDRIAAPINAGVRECILLVDGSTVTPQQREQFSQGLTGEERLVWGGDTVAQQDRWVRRARLAYWWNNTAWPMNWIGLVIALVLIMLVGIGLSGYIGRRLVQRGEALLARIPIIRNVYPSVKQVTQFFVGGEDKKIKFNRVVAVEYPRRGMWSVGLVTAESMPVLESRAGGPCVTIFVPSSPAPFTGWVIVVPVADTIELPMTIEEALRFFISGGVIVPISASTTGIRTHPGPAAVAPQELTVRVLPTSNAGGASGPP